MNKLIYCTILLLLPIVNVQAKDSRPCNDEQLYLAVIESAKRDMPKPYSQWELKGAAGNFINLKPGYCKATLLYLNGNAGGKMAEVDVSFKKDVNLANIRVAPIQVKSSSQCQPIRFKKGHVAGSVSGELAPNDRQCYSLDVGANQTAKVSITSRIKNTIFSIDDVVDGVDNVEFITKKKTYYINLFQLMRATNNDSYLLNVEVR